MPEPGEITRRLNELDPEDPASYDALWRLVYDRLRELARMQLRKRRPGATLNATALVHESFLKLRAAEQVDLKGHEHFYAVATLAMKQIIIDYAKARTRQKRGEGSPHIPLDEAKAFIPAEEEAYQHLALHDALERYGKLDPDGKKIFEYAYFLNLTHAEIADKLSVSSKTVQRGRRRARAWLKTNYVAA